MMKFALALALLATPAWAQEMFPGNPLAESLAKSLKEEAGISAVRGAALVTLQAEIKRREAEWGEYSKSLWAPK